jgi:hypothetical protein
MMGEFVYKCCRICGSDITIEAEICPLCSSRQQPEKRVISTGLIIALAGFGFFGVMLLGIISAHAIQQFICFRTTTCNAAALNNLKAAKVGLDQYFARNGRYPETLDQIFFKHDDGVSVTFNKVADKTYRLVSFHKQGDREFLAISGKMGMYSKNWSESSFRYVMVDTLGRKSDLVK